MPKSKKICSYWKKKWQNPVPDLLKRSSLGLFTAVFLASLFKLCSFDLFWHLECGQYFFENFKIIEHNTFSWTYPDYPWIPTYWLFQAILYGIWNISGFTGLIIFNALLLASTFMILASTLEKKGLLNLLTFVVLIALIDLSLFRFMLRPHIFTFLGLSLLIRWTSEPEFFIQVKSSLLKIFLLFLLWANLHSGVVFGLAFLAIFLATECFKNFSLFRNALLIVLISLGAVCLNPTGTGFLTYVLDHTHLENTISLEEFAPFRPLHHVKQTLLLIFILLPPALTLIYRKTFNLRHLALASINAYLLSKGIRFLPEIGILWIPVWIDSLQNISVHSPLLKPFRSPFAWLIGILFALYLHCFVYTLPECYLKTGFGISETAFPEILGEHIHEKPGLRLYNSFSLGGYILWVFEKKIPVFQDGRIHAYPSPFFQELEQARNNDELWNSYLIKHQINTIILNKEEATSFEMDSCKKAPFKTLYEDPHFIFASSLE